MASLHDDDIRSRSAFSESGTTLGDETDTDDMDTDTDDADADTTDADTDDTDPS